MSHRRSELGRRRVKHIICRLAITLSCALHCNASALMKSAHRHIIIIITQVSCALWSLQAHASRGGDNRFVAACHVDFVSLIFHCSWSLVSRAAPTPSHASVQTEAARHRRGSKRRMTRPQLLYANERYQEFKRARIATGCEGLVSRPQYKTLMQTWAAEFAALPPQDQHEFRAQAFGSGSQQPHVPPHEVCPRAPGPVCSFFGQASDEFPIGIDHMAAAFGRCVGQRAVDLGDLPGITTHGRQLRQELLRNAFIEDEHAIPADAKFQYACTCWLRYRGICKTLDADRWGRLAACASKLHAAFEESRWFCISATRADAPEELQSLHVFVAFLRGRSPKLAIALRAHAHASEGDGGVVVQLVVSDGQLDFMTPAMISRMFLRHARESSEATCSHRITVKKLVVQPVLEALDRVTIEACQEIAEVYAHRSLRAKRLKTPAPPPAGGMAARDAMFSAALDGLPVASDRGRAQRQQVGSRLVVSTSATSAQLASDIPASAHATEELCMPSEDPVMSSEESWPGDDGHVSDNVDDPGVVDALPDCLLGGLAGLHAVAGGRASSSTNVPPAGAAASGACVIVSVARPSDRYRVSCQPDLHLLSCVQSVCSPPRHIRQVLAMAAAAVCK